MDSIFYKDGNIRWQVVVVKSLASALSIGTGAAVGREGPIIQIGAALGSAFSQAIRLAPWQKVTLLSAGAGAGIAATFNTLRAGALDPVRRRGWAPIRRKPPPGGGWRSCGTTIPARGARRTRGPSP